MVTKSKPTITIECAENCGIPLVVDLARHKLKLAKGQKEFRHQACNHAFAGRKWSGGR
jgi:hypothetical protein